MKVKNSYLVENDCVYFRRAKKDDNMDEIANLIYEIHIFIHIGLKKMKENVLTF